MLKIILVIEHSFHYRKLGEKASLQGIIINNGFVSALVDQAVCVLCVCELCSGLTAGCELGNHSWWVLGTLWDQINQGSNPDWHVQGPYLSCFY